jgi:hypothetical protein
MADVWPPRYARTGKANPALTEKLEVQQQLCSRTVPTNRHRSRQGPYRWLLSADIGRRRIALALLNVGGSPPYSGRLQRRRRRGLRAAPRRRRWSPAPGQSSGGCARGKVPRPPPRSGWRFWLAF